MFIVTMEISGCTQGALKMHLGVNQDDSNMDLLASRKDYTPRLDDRMQKACKDVYTGQPQNCPFF